MNQNRSNIAQLMHVKREAPTPRWFIVALPDDARASTMSARLSNSATTMIPHRSGRPWLLTNVPSVHHVVAPDGPTRLVMIGAASGAMSSLRSASRATQPAQLHQTLSGVPGAYVAFASIEGQLYARGNVSGTRRVFQSQIDGMHLLADRADLLAELAQTELNPSSLALSLVRALPHPLSEQAIWEGVEPIAPGTYVVVDRFGSKVRTTKWWTPPDRSLGLVDAGARLRTALERAVNARTTSSPLACDLSGGLDSTPICYFASRTQPGSYAYTAYNADPGGQADLDWAERAAASMPHLLDHIAVDTSGMPAFYAELRGRRGSVDSPTEALLAAPRMTDATILTGTLGSNYHLNGIGGDHLFSPMLPWVHSLIRAQPWRGWRVAQAARRTNATSAWRTFLDLADVRTYRTWLSSTGRRISTSVRSTEIGDWSTPPSIPRWVTPSATAQVRELIVRASREPALGPNRATHIGIQAIRDAARIARGASQITGPLGAIYDSPLLDDEVVEVCLSTRLDVQVQPTAWKPIVKEAMVGRLSPDFLSRSSKVGGAAQGIRGLNSSLPEVTSLIEDRVDMLPAGLIDLRALRATLEATSRSRMPDTHLAETIALFVFLDGLCQTSEPIG